MMKKPQPRLIPTKRTALDGLVWWVVYDPQTRRYSTRPCFGRYRRKKDCQWAIDYYTSDDYYDRQLARLWALIRQNGGRRNEKMVVRNQRHRVHLARHE